MEKQRFHSSPYLGYRNDWFIGRSLVGRLGGRAATGVTACAAVLAMALLMSACSSGEPDAQAAPNVSALPDYSGSCGCNKAEKRKSYARAMQEIHPDAQ
jgi:hypothetical protein